MSRKVCISFLGIALLMFFLVSCGGEEQKDEGDESKGGANFKIVNKQTGINSNGNPYVRITVKNVGGDTGYNVLCYVDAKKEGKVEDTGVAEFNNLDDIDPGEQATSDAEFFILSTLTGYELEYELLWLHMR